MTYTQPKVALDNSAARSAIAQEDHERHVALLRDEVRSGRVPYPARKVG